MYVNVHKKWHYSSVAAPCSPVVEAVQALFRAFPLNWKQQQSKEGKEFYSPKMTPSPPTSLAPSLIPSLLSQCNKRCQANSNPRRPGRNPKIGQSNQVTGEETEKDGGSGFAAIGAVTILDS